MHNVAGVGAGPALLTAEQERQLAAEIEAGLFAGEALRSGSRPDGATVAELQQLVTEGQSAQRRFTEANLRLVRMVSHQFAARSGANEADVFQEGCLGLLTAVMRFDHRRGLRFATYALFWIRAYAGSAAARMLGDLNLPTSRATQLRAVRGVEAALTQTLGRAATTRDIAVAVGRSELWTADLLAHLPPTSLSAVETDAQSWAVTDDPGPSNEPSVLLHRLRTLDRQVLELRLGFVTGGPLSYAEVAGRLGIAVSRVRRIEQAALEELRLLCPYDAAWS
jgi:RNA polymerase sigma factor (sigma-70 family)